MSFYSYSKASDEQYHIIGIAKLPVKL